MKINKLHFYFGLATFTGFVITGIFLRVNAFHVDSGDLQTRMMFRSNHIYILFASFLHLLIAFINPGQQTSIINNVRHTGSAFTILSTITLYIAFFVDPISKSIQRDMTRISVVGLVVGLIILLLGYKLSLNDEDTKFKK